MKIAFTKMHGIGNDYIYVNCMDGEWDNYKELAIAMSPRRFSVGSDGLIAICPSAVADAKMRMFNLDGSEGKMCGNGIRCVGKYLYDNKLVDKTTITVETLSGIKTLKLFAQKGKVQTVSVDMGTAELAPRRIPILADGERFVNEPYTVGGKEYRLTCVSMGNPHAVVFVDDTESLPLQNIGPQFEYAPLFPEQVNTEFIKVLGPQRLQMRVWERGSGETYACGTGACASVVAAVLNGYCAFDTPITVKLVGGDLTIQCSPDFKVTMTGSATKAYEGVYEYEDSAE